MNEVIGFVPRHRRDFVLNVCAMLPLILCAVAVVFLVCIGRLGAGSVTGLLLFAAFTTFGAGIKFSEWIDERTGWHADRVSQRHEELVSSGERQPWCERSLYDRSGCGWPGCSCKSD